MTHTNADTETAEIKICIRTGEIEIVGKEKKYRGFPGALKIATVQLKRLNVKYTHNYGWTHYCATVTLIQWAEIRSALRTGLERVKNTHINDGRKCTECGCTESRGARFTTAPRSMAKCDDCT